MGIKSQIKKSHSNDKRMSFYSYLVQIHNVSKLHIPFMINGLIKKLSDCLII